MTDFLTMHDVVDASKVLGQFSIEIEVKDLVDCLTDNTFSIDFNITDQVLTD